MAVAESRRVKLIIDKDSRWKEITRFNAVIILEPVPVFLHLSHLGPQGHFVKLYFHQGILVNSVLARGILSNICRFIFYYTNERASLVSLKKRANCKESTI